MAGMWRCGFCVVVNTALVVILSGIVNVIGESPAEAAFLNNGARAGNKRIETIRPPRAGSKNRLRSLKERQSAPAKPAKKSGAKRKRQQQHAWFWKVYSPSISARDGARWGDALLTMTKRRAESNVIFATETVAAIDLAYRRIIAAAARKHGLSEALLVAVITAESLGKPQARSPKGAQGLMQLIPATAKRFGVQDAYQPAQNIEGGAAYLDWLLKEFDGDVLLALAGYNAGEGAVRKHKGVPPYTETRDYVVKVLDAAAIASTLCSGDLTSPRSRCIRAAGQPAG